jgi:hypothetical protein
MTALRASSDLQPFLCIPLEFDFTSPPSSVKLPRHEKIQPDIQLVVALLKGLPTEMKRQV